MTNQIEIPASFIALFLRAGQQKPDASRNEIASRYELCEDMANLLTETASSMLFSLHITESDVLQRVLAGLQGEGAVVTPPEATWVARRLAELQGWEWREASA